MRINAESASNEVSGKTTKERQESMQKSVAFSRESRQIWHDQTVRHWPRGAAKLKVELRTRTP